MAYAASRRCKVKVENIIFDFDGTLVDTAEDVVDCLQEAYQAVLSGQTVNVESGHIGPQLKEMIENITPDLEPETVIEIMRHFRQLYDNSTYPKTRMRPGIPELLTGLQKQAILMFIVTNKPKHATLKILKTLGMDYFREVVTPDFFPGKIVPKEAMIHYLVENYGLAASTTLMVGDSDTDVSAARQHRIKTLVVLDGYGNRELIRTSQPEFQVNRIDDINHFVMELIKNGS